MVIEVHRGLIPFMIKDKEVRRAAEKFKRDEDSQYIESSYLFPDIFVRQMESNCYIFT